MQRCEGVVLLLDDQATPFMRIWCCASVCLMGDFEDYQAFWGMGNYPVMWALLKKPF